MKHDNMKMMKKLAVANAVAVLLATGAAVQAQGTTTHPGGTTDAGASSAQPGGTTGAGGSSASAMAASPMKADEIREILKSQGYSDLDELKYEGREGRRQGPTGTQRALRAHH